MNSRIMMNIVEFLQNSKNTFKQGEEALMADLFGKIKGSIDKSVATVSVKSNEFVETTKFKTQIATLEKEIEELQKTVGKGYHRKWLNQESDFEEINEICVIIKAKEAEIESCKQEIKNLQNESKKILNAEDGNKCPSCGAVNKENAKFCAGCGMKLIEDDTTFCSCGAKVKLTAKFCPACGNPMQSTVVEVDSVIVEEVIAAEEVESSEVVDEADE